LLCEIWTRWTTAQKTPCVIVWTGSRTAVVALTLCERLRLPDEAVTDVVRMARGACATSETIIGMPHSLRVTVRAQDAGLVARTLLDFALEHAEEVSDDD